MKALGKTWLKPRKHFLDFLTGTFSGISVSEVDRIEEMIFPAEKFLMPEVRDVFGNHHPNFHAYEVFIRPFCVRSFKNAYCLVDREEVFSSQREVIIEYTSQKSNPLIGTPRTVLHRRKVKKIDGRVAHLSLSGLENNYYHYLTECLGRLYLIEKSAFKPDYYVISDQLPFQSELLELIGIGKNQIISTNGDDLIQAEELVVADLINNWEFVEFRGYQHCQKQWLPSWFTQVGDKFIQRRKESPLKRVYITRSQAKYRKIENEEQVQDLFVRLGFSVHSLEGMSVREQIDLFSDASFIAGLHGAGFVNMMFAPRTATVFEIFPEFYHDASFRILAKTLGLRYYYMIGETKDRADRHPQQENIFVDIELLRKSLDIVLATS